MPQHFQSQYEMRSICFIVSIGPLGPLQGIRAAVAGHMTVVPSPHMSHADRLPVKTQGKVLY
jgi:hypothetical protein